MLSTGVRCGAPLSPRPLGEGPRAGVCDQGGKVSAPSSLRPVAWPGLAGKACVSDKWGQPALCPARPVLTVLSLQPGSLQVRLRASMLSGTRAGKWPDPLRVASTDCDGGCQPPRPGALPWGPGGMLLGVQNPGNPRRLPATQLEPAGGNGGSIPHVGLTKGVQEGRGKRKKKAKGE